MQTRVALPCLLLLVACPKPKEEVTTLGPPVSSHGVAACLQDGVDGVTHPGQHCATFRGIAGISMGGGAAARIALQNPELFDVIGTLGSPYIDLETFLFSVGKVDNGGFCPRQQLLDNLAGIDQQDNPAVWCGPVPFADHTLPGSACTGFPADFNHQYRGPEAGRGGTFDRVSSFQIVQDVALAFGNPGFFNPDSPYLPPGVPLSAHVPLELEAPGREQELAAARADICAHPVVLNNFHEAFFNPTGEYPVISFCDGNGAVNGVYTPGVATFPLEVGLAVDFNRNGRRDYGEPVITAGLELYDDVGSDGVADAQEPGYDPVTNPDPAHDNHDWLTNPLGTENNFRHDVGEPFQDTGLDGVPGTGDYGEANGTYDQSPNLTHIIANSPRRLAETLDARMFSRLHIWADSGIRDFLNSAIMTNGFFGAVMQRTSNTRLFTDWADLAHAAGQPDGQFNPSTADFSSAAVGRHAYLRYGDPSVCPGVDVVEGRGNHVGANWELLNRLKSSAAFFSARVEGGDFREVPGTLAEQGGPTQTLDDFILNQTFQSTALGRTQPYSVVLPPDYYERPESTYPVFYFLHGQGQKAADLAASALIFLGPQMASDSPARQAQGRSDWQKMIIVFADGECHPGECHTGTFYVDFTGVDGHGPRHGAAFLELMAVVDQRFRTRVPQMRAGDGPQN